MTKGEIVPVTVLEAGPCPVVQVKTKSTHGYEAVQVGFGDAKAQKFLETGSGPFRQGPCGTDPRWMEEFRVPAAAGFEPGMEIRVDQFVAGDVVDASGHHQRKGFRRRGQTAPV